VEENLVSLLAILWGVDSITSFKRGSIKIRTARSAAALPGKFRCGQGK
jgi:hypothetical protein